MLSPAPPCSNTPVANNPTILAFRIGSAAVIFIVSLLASSFPSLTKRAPHIEPPLVVFFIGKHFGTGVILSTAFVHLLQEGFESLLDPCLAGSWRKWTGFTVLLSFLLIFLIEYISTAYVEHLSSAEAETSHSRLHEHEHLITHYHDDPDVETSPLGESQGNGDAIPSHVMHVEGILVAVDSPYHARSASRQSFPWHHRHESPYSHPHEAGPRLSKRQTIASASLADHETEAIPREVHIDHSHGHEPVYEEDAHGMDIRQGEVSRKTRIIAILVLQLGIMIHSVVIAFTLSITAGSKFTSLFVSIIFHQLFEGLSLGIRIANLPQGGRATHVLPTILCVLFAIAAPVGIFLGIWLFPSVPPYVKSNIAKEIFTDDAGQFMMARLSKGLMCTISAGMLIYASAVEMLAGDFVLDPEMRRNGFWMQVLALGSLIVGVVAMTVLH